MSFVLRPREPRREPFRGAVLTGVRVRDGREHDRTRSVSPSGSVASDRCTDRAPERRQPGRGPTHPSRRRARHPARRARSVVEPSPRRPQRLAATARRLHVARESQGEPVPPAVPARRRARRPSRPGRRDRRPRRHERRSRAIAAISRSASIVPSRRSAGAARHHGGGRGSPVPPPRWRPASRRSRGDGSPSSQTAVRAARR